MAKEPGYCLHKPSGRAYVNLSGRVHYLGPHGSPESKAAYNRLKAEWLVAKGRDKIALPCLAELCLAYLEHAEAYYAASTEFANIKLAIRPISELYATTQADAFGAIQYKAVREWWLSDPARSRSYVNKQMKRLVRVLKWGVGAGLMPPENLAIIKCIDPLKRGRCTAKESKPVLPVPAALVMSTLPHLTQVVADMVRFQQLVGCRPGELVKITPSMVDRSAEVWTIVLSEHKTAYLDKHRTLYVGPKAQAVLKPYLLRGADDACFSPQESERQRLEAVHAKRVTPLNCGNRPGTNRIARKPRKAPGTAFTASSYAKSIAGACKRSKLTHWHPNQLRHSAATEIRKRFGLEAAQVILGHSGADITQTYAERDAAKAVEVARAIG
jgi:integrase